MKIKRPALIFSLLFVVVLAVLIWTFLPKNYSYSECVDACEAKGYESGMCSGSEISDSKAIGKCNIPGSEVCETGCKCYCLEEILVGGCAGVALENVQECCDDWAEEHGIVRIACVGEWEIVEGVCSWECSSVVE